MNEVLTYSVEDAGRALGVGRSVAFRLVHERVIPSIKLGKKLRVPKAALNKLLAGEALQKDEVTR